jgi:hypothetical protein
METISSPKLLPRPERKSPSRKFQLLVDGENKSKVLMPELLLSKQIESTYRVPLEAFLDNSIVIIVGDRKETPGTHKLYTNCRIFTAMSKTARGTRKQKKIFEEKPVLDHLWIPEGCSRLNEDIGVSNLFAVGKIVWYSRKNGTKDLALEPVKIKEHLEVLFMGIVFIYGLHILEQVRKLLEEGVLSGSREVWKQHLDWLRNIADKFKETISRKKIILENSNMLKYIDSFLNQIDKKIKKTDNHFKRMSEKKGFSKKLLAYS